MCNRRTIAVHLPPVHYPRAVTVSVFVAAFLLSACGSSGDATAAASAANRVATGFANQASAVQAIATSATSAAAAAAATSATSTVVVHTDAKLGSILTDPAGRTLYWYTKDTPGVSNCSGGCLTAWPAFISAANPTLPSGVPGKIATITRADGTIQATYDGMPLYYYSKDAKAGDVAGQSVGKVWFVVTPTAGPLTAPAS
jgi:predicted lipoprotein with Yx(FWY)xxD motif